MEIEKNLVEEAQGLLENKQYLEFRHFVEEMNEADIAALLEELPPEEMIKAFRILPKSLAAEVFSYMELGNEQSVITSMSDKDAAWIIDNLMADDAADLLEEMPAGVVKKLLAAASPETRRDVNHLLKYPEDSAGSVMTVEYIDLKDNLTAAQALERVRRKGEDSETADVCFIVDPQRALKGTVTLRKLVFAQPDELISELMNDSVISVNTNVDQEEVAAMFKKYDYTSMPVVDNEDRLVGIITVDDIVDVMEAEATEDIEKMAAILPTDKPYMKTGVWETYKKRVPWLLLLMISATFTGAIISHFEAALATCAALTMFIPMIMDTGGNAGGQASVSIIRGLSLGEIDYRDVPRIIFKECRVALLCGATLAICNFVKLMIFDRPGFWVAVVVCLALVVTIFIAKFVGCTLPILAKRIGFDPAVMASPFITTIVDALSLMVYFGFAKMILKL